MKALKSIRFVCRTKSFIYIKKLNISLFMRGTCMQTRHVAKGVYKRLLQKIESIVTLGGSHEGKHALLLVSSRKNSEIIIPWHNHKKELHWKTMDFPQQFFRTFIYLFIYLFLFVCLHRNKKYVRCCIWIKKNLHYWNPIPKYRKTKKK